MDSAGGAEAPKAPPLNPPLHLVTPQNMICNMLVENKCWDLGPWSELRHSDYRDF